MTAAELATLAQQAADMLAAVNAALREQRDEGAAKLDLWHRSGALTSRAEALARDLGRLGK